MCTSRCKDSRNVYALVYSVKRYAMSEFVQEISKLNIDDLLMQWAQVLGVSTMVMAFIGFVSWCFWYVIRSFRAIISK